MKDEYDKIVEETATYEDFKNFMLKFETRSVDPDKLLELYREKRKNKRNKD